MAKKKSKASLFKVFKRVNGLLLKKSPGSLFLYIFIGILSSGFLAMLSIFKENFFNSVEESIGLTEYSETIWLGVIMGLALLLSIALNALFDVVEENFFAKMTGSLGTLLNEKASRIDPICYDDNKYLDNINKAQNGLQSSSRVFGFLAYFLFKLVPFFIFIGIYFTTVRLELLFLLFTAFIPSIISSILRFKIFKKSEVKLAPYRRKYEYYGKCISEKEYAKETRLLGGFGYFYKLFRSSLHDASDIIWKAGKHDEINELIAKIMMMIGYLSTLGLAVYFLINGDIKVGAFAAVISTLDTLFDYLENAFNYCIGGLTRHLPIAINYEAFMELPERNGKDFEVLARTFELNNVSFKYPFQNNYALKNINLKIDDGDTIAIVGENGAGKSTIVKLIMGLYLPTEGTVLVDGLDTRKISPNSLYKNMTATFQNFNNYKMKLSDCIYLSDVSKPFDLTKANLSFDKADFEIDERFESGLDTMLSREFGKLDLSGGQWQRLALARCYYRDHNFIVLDEPTAAIDPIEETELYNKFSELSQNKTSIIVTHRLGSAKIASKIVVMKDGKIDDIGTHDELISKKGYYYELYLSQAKWYI